MLGRFRLTPSGLRFHSGFSGTNASRFDFTVPVVRARSPVRGARAAASSGASASRQSMSAASISCIDW